MLQPTQEQTSTEFTNLLLSALDPGQVHIAEKRLREAEEHSICDFLLLCARELGDCSKPSMSRHFAGMLLKNAISSSRLGARQKFLNERWLTLVSTDVKASVREAAVKGLAKASERAVWSVAASIIAKIGVLEIPRGLWPACIPWLQNAADGKMGHQVREPALLAIAYLAEDWWYAFIPEAHGAALEEPLDLMMGASVRGMARNEPLAVRKRATEALFAILGNVQAHLAHVERQSVLVGALLSNCDFNIDQELSHLSYRCLGRLATESYALLAPSAHEMLRMTLIGLRDGPELVAISSVGFWTSVGMQELAMAESSSGYLSSATPTLVPVLLSVLSRGFVANESDKSAPAVLHEAIRDCLALICHVAPQAGVDLIFAFVASNFESENYYSRSAAITAYGSLMDGPAIKIGPIVASSFGVLLRAMDDTTLRRVAAWSVGRALELHASNVPADAIQALWPACMNLVRDPDWSEEFSFVLEALAIREAAFPANVSSVIQQLVQGLRETNSRSCASLLRAISALVQRLSDPNSHEVLQNLLVELLRLADQSGALHGEVLGLGSCLKALTENQGDAITLELADAMMKLYTSALEAGISSRLGLHEETLSAVASLAAALKARFQRYMPAFWPVLVLALNDPEFPVVCTTALTVAYETIKALGSAIQPYAEQLQVIALRYVRDPGLLFDLRPLSVSVVGALIRELGHSTPDLASALLALRMTLVVSTVGNKLKPQDARVCSTQPQKKRLSQRAPDSWGRRQNLAVSVLKAYEDVVLGLANTCSLDCLEDQLMKILDFVACCVIPVRVETNVLDRVLRILGPLAERFPGGLATFCWSDEAKCITKLVDFGSQSLDISLQDASAKLAALRDA